MKKTKEQYTVQLEPEFVAKIDLFAEKHGLTRSQVMRNFLHMAYDDAVLLDNIGVLSAVQFGQKLISKIRIGIASGKITFDEEGELEIKK